MANSIMVIHPYKYQGMWVFDDNKVGLLQEPFISGADDIIDKMVVDISNASNGFSLLFSAIMFPGYQCKFEWQRHESGGNWYIIKILDMEGWLCPALFKYFKTAPQNIYAQFKRRQCE
ncbi:hypothetical protein MNBD_GAMMA12-838 [hydrothermal vent metagenome]|uniref:Uncharacterized protein n=1 Tax=hydrothermal vent metagenome TaxID=652676 RepID=A0A3B0YVC4_9ZZZZ